MVKFSLYFYLVIHILFPILLPIIYGVPIPIFPTDTTLRIYIASALSYIVFSISAVSIARYTSNKFILQKHIHMAIIIASSVATLAVWEYIRILQGEQSLLLFIISQIAFGCILTERFRRNPILQMLCSFACEALFSYWCFLLLLHKTSWQSVVLVVACGFIVSGISLVRYSLLTLKDIRERALKSKGLLARLTVAMNKFLTPVRITKAAVFLFFGGIFLMSSLPFFGALNIEYTLVLGIIALSYKVPDMISGSLTEIASGNRSIDSEAIAAKITVIMCAITAGVIVLTGVITAFT